MPNPYYTYENDLIPATRARSSEIDAQFRAIEAAFDAISASVGVADGMLQTGVDDGIVNALDLTTESGGQTPFDMQVILTRPAFTNTDAVTIALNGGTQFPVIRNDGTPLASNDLIAGIPVAFIFDDLESRWALVGATAEQTKIAARPVVREISETDYTLGPDDEATILRFTSDEAVTVTVPLEASQALDDGFLVHIYQDGEGQVTVAPEGVVEILKPDTLSLTTSGQYASLTLLKVSADSWRLTKITYEENIGVELYRPTTTTISETTHTLSADNENSVLIFDNAAEITVTIDTQANVPLPDGYLVHLYQDGAGQVSVEAATGVTLTYSASLSPNTTGQGTSVSLLKVADDDWRLMKITFEEPGDYVFRPDVREISDTTHTIGGLDENAVLSFTSADAVTVTVPDNATVPLDVGFLCHLYQDGEGQVTVTNAVGVTLTYSLSAATRAQYSSLSLVKVGTDDWRLVGDAALP